MALRATHNDVPFHIGDTVRIHYKIVEIETKAGKTKKSTTTETKERIQPFEGVVIAINGEHENKSITVRRHGAGNVGIERIFPLVSPWINKVTVTRKGVVRRSKLYFIRGKSELDTTKSLS